MIDHHKLLPNIKLLFIIRMLTGGTNQTSLNEAVDMTAMPRLLIGIFNPFLLVCLTP